MQFSINSLSFVRNGSKGLYKFNDFQLKFYALSIKEILINHLSFSIAIRYFGDPKNPAMQKLL